MFYIGDEVRNKLNGNTGVIVGIEGKVADTQQYNVSMDIGGTNVYAEDALEITE